jgi:rsbT co-antagonist protein RsbR
MRSIPNRRAPRRIQQQAPREQPGGAALLAENGLTDQEIATRKAFLEFGPGDAQRLAALAPLARKYAGDVIEDLYAHFLSFSSTREFFRDQPTLRRVKRLQKRYFLRLTSGRYDRNYIANRLLVGASMNVLD